MGCQLFVFSSEGFEQLELLVAASRAGSTPVLALNALPAERAASSLRLLTQRCAEGFAVSIADLNEDSRSLLSGFIPKSLKSVVLTDPTCESLSDSIQWFRSRGLAALVEVTSLPEALRAAECGAEGLIAKGSESGGRVSEETTFILLQQILRSDPRTGGSRR